MSIEITQQMKDLSRMSMNDLMEQHIPFYYKYGAIVVDQLDDIPVEVKRRHVDVGEQLDPSACAIAQALIETRRWIKDVRISATFNYIRLQGSNIALRSKLDREDKRMVESFDRARYFRPCTVVLRSLHGTSQAIGERAGQAPGTNVRTGQQRTGLNSLPTRSLVSFD